MSANTDNSDSKEVFCMKKKSKHKHLNMDHLVKHRETYETQCWFPMQLS